MKKVSLLLVLLLSSWAASAQVDKMLGRWVTVEKGVKESIVDIYRADNGLVYGRIMDLVDPANAKAVCVKCGGEDAGKPIKGLLIIKDMHVDGNNLTGGKILDPKRGKWFDCTIKLDGNNLSVRGSLGPFGETKTWVRQ